MVEHLQFNEFDMAAITNAVTRYKSAGLQADYNIEDKDLGIVRIALENPVRRDGSIAIFEIHKLTRPGFFGRKAHWVVQIYSKDIESDTPKKHGCVAASMQGNALWKAEVDLNHGFVSIADFELATQAY